jgi:hypothetical protein
MSGERLQTIAVGRVRAVVGEMRRQPAASAVNLRRYSTVVETLACRVPAILPARFASIVTDADELRFVLRSRAASFRKRLARVRNRSQMTVRLLSVSSESEYGDGPYPSRSTVMRRDVLRLDRRGTQYLRQKMAESAAAHTIPAFAPIRAAVERYVKDERVEKRAGVVTVIHLVPRSATSQYRTAIERAAEQQDVRLIVTGPSAPYAFAESW